jgi:hypothetical protein
MPYKIASPVIVAQAATESSTTQKVPLGTIVPIVDNALAVPQAGAAIYVKSSDAILRGSLVMFDLQLATAVLGPAAAGVGPCGVALAAIPTGSFGWLQIDGNAAVKCPNAVAAGANVFPLAATPGSVDDAAVAGEQILGAKFSTTTPVPEANFAWMTINRPHYQGQIT